MFFVSSTLFFIIFSFHFTIFGETSSSSAKYIVTNMREKSCNYWTMTSSVFLHKFQIPSRHKSHKFHDLSLPLTVCCVQLDFFSSLHHVHKCTSAACQFKMKCINFYINMRSWIDINRFEILFSHQHYSITSTTVATLNIAGMYATTMKLRLKMMPVVASLFFFSRYRKMRVYFFH